MSNVLEDNRRDSFRMPQPEGRERARLKVGRKSVDCQIIDESAGGFHIVGEKLPPTPPTEPVELLTVAGRHALRVVWRRTDADGTRLGLERLPDDYLRRNESSWMIWMIVAVLVGFGGGYVFAIRDEPLGQLPLWPAAVEISAQDASLPGPAPRDED